MKEKINKTANKKRNYLKIIVDTFSELRYLARMKWITERRRISDLIPFQGNPRQLTKKQAADLEKSLKKFDLAEIPAINTNNKILAGHQRLLILKTLGRASEEIDVRVPDRELTPEEEREYLIRSNANTGEWDWDTLANNFDVPELVDWGLDDKFLGAWNVDGVENPDMLSGDRAPFQQMTFTLHDEQAEEINAAIAKAKSEGGGQSAVNENSNGNALAWICGRFNRG